MNYYVVCDINGHYDEFKKLLAIAIQEEQYTVFLAGDSIGEGSQNSKMIEYLSGYDFRQIYPLKGDKEYEFIQNVKKLQDTINRNNVMLSEAYDLLKQNSESFDQYSIIIRLIKEDSYNIEKLTKAANMFSCFNTHSGVVMNGRSHYIVHAGITCSPDIDEDYTNVNLYSKGTRCFENAAANSVVIAGHSSTADKSEFVYNNGRIFKYHSEKNKCEYYNINCFSGQSEKDVSRFACLRLNDRTEYYI